MEWKPNKWVAVVLGFFGQPLGMLYVVRARWALIYFATSLLIAVIEIVLREREISAWLQYFTFNYIVMVVCAVHAYRIAINSPSRSDRPWYSRWYGLISIPGLIALGMFSIRALVVEPFRFPSASMVPTINPGAILIAKKWGYGNYGTYGISVLRTRITADLKRGDIIVFDFPGDLSIRYAKRIIGIPGDTIEYQNRRLKINGASVETHVIGLYGDYQIVEEKIFGITYHVANILDRPFRDVKVEVPSDNFFVLGDNRDRSNDSRYWGFVPAKNVVGKIIYTPK